MGLCLPHSEPEPDRTGTCGRLRAFEFLPTYLELLGLKHQEYESSFANWSHVSFLAVPLIPSILVAVCPQLTESLTSIPHLHHNELPETSLETMFWCGGERFRRQACTVHRRLPEIEACPCFCYPSVTGHLETPFALTPWASLTKCS